MEKDTYKTLLSDGEETLFKEKNSKFFGYAFAVENEEQIKDILAKIKKEHYSARHWCYAYQIGTGAKAYFRANDDGEPNNSAGMPIYGQIQSFDLTNVLVIVVRYFGGIKLGVGGLVQAYRTSAQLALESSTFVEKTIDTHFILSFDYKDMNKVMRIIKEKNANLVHQEMEMSCVFEISIRKSQANQLLETFQQVYGIEIKEKE